MSITVGVSKGLTGLNYPQPVTSSGGQPSKVVPSVKSMTVEEVEHLLCKRVLIYSPNNYDGDKLFETHIWEISTNRKFVKLGSAAHGDHGSPEWIPIQNLKVVDVLPENHYSAKQIQKRLKSLKEQMANHQKDGDDFIFRI